MYTKGTGGANQEIQSFMNYLANSSMQQEIQSSSLLVNAASQRVKEVKQGKEMEGIFMNLNEKIQTEKDKTFYNSIRDMIELGVPENKILEKYKDRITEADIERIKNTQPEN